MPRYRVIFEFGPTHQDKNIVRTPNEGGTTIDLGALETEFHMTSRFIYELYLDKKHEITVWYGPMGMTDFDDPTAKARQAQSSNRHARLGALLTYYLDNPNAGPTEASRAIGVSRQTIYNYLEELQAAGRVARNDGMIEVLDAGRS